MSQTTLRIIDLPSLETAVNQLRLRDPACIDAMIAVAGPPPLRLREAGLPGLIRIIISQQVSTASADAIYARYCARFANASASELCAAPDTGLQSCGLSLPKIKTIKRLSEALANSELDLELLQEMDSQTARTTLTAVKGIGPWTADVYLLFCLGHPNVWPAGDLALQEGVRMALNLRKRPDAARLEKISTRWKPWRAAAARIIWAYYGARRAQQTQTSTTDVSKTKKPGKKW